MPRDCVRVIWILNEIQRRCTSIVRLFYFLLLPSHFLPPFGFSWRTAPRTERVSMGENFLTDRHPLNLDSLNGSSDSHCTWQIMRTRGISWYWGAYLGRFFAIRRVASWFLKPRKWTEGYMRAASFCFMAGIMRNSLWIHNHLACACRSPKVLQALPLRFSFSPPHLFLPSQRQLIASHGALLHFVRTLLTNLIDQTFFLTETSLLQLSHVTQAHAPAFINLETS